jgi:hypothetical protein
MQISSRGVGVEKICFRKKIATDLWWSPKKAGLKFLVVRKEKPCYCKGSD